VIQQLPSGWLRISVTFTMNNTGNNTISVRVGGDIALVSTGVFYLWGVQAEEGAYPTSYIPTTGVAVTRAADVYTSVAATRVAEAAPITQTTPWVDRAKGTVLVDVSNMDSESNFCYLAFFSQNADTSGEWFGLGWINKTSLRLRSFSNSDIITVTSVDRTDLPIKAAFTWDGTTFQLAVNGVYYSGTDAVIPNEAFNRLKVGHSGSTQSESITSKQLKYYPYAMTQAELEAITS